MFFLSTILLILAASWGALALYAWVFADRVIFQPPPPSYTGESELIRILTPDGVSLAAVHLRHPTSPYTILYFHGNAEDIGDARPQLEGFYRLGFSVFAFDYRGYGLSGGHPAEQKVYDDTETVVAYLRDQLNVAPSRLVAYGRSLGGGPATAFVGRHPAAGLILEGCFTSAFRVVTRWTLLPWDRFNNLARMKGVRCPVLVVHGTADRVVPFWHGRRLFEALPGQKEFFPVEGAGHNDLIDTAGPRYWKAVAGFVQSLPAWAAGS